METLFPGAVAAPTQPLSDEELNAIIQQVLAQGGAQGSLQQGMQAAQAPQAPQAAPAPAAPQQDNSFGAILGALKAPTPDIRYSGGVSGVQIPYRTAITDMMSPFLAQLAQTRQQSSGLPSLGTLLSQAPGVR